MADHEQGEVDDSAEDEVRCAEGIGDDRLYGVGVDAATIVWPGCRDRRSPCARSGTLAGKGLASGEAEAAGVALHGGPLGRLDELLRASRRLARRSRRSIARVPPAPATPARTAARHGVLLGCVRAGIRTRPRCRVGPVGRGPRRQPLAQPALSSRPASAVETGRRPGRRLAGARRGAMPHQEHQRPRGKAWFVAWETPSLPANLVSDRGQRPGHGGPNWARSARRDRGVRRAPFW